MCGICGFAGPNGRLTQDDLARMNGAIIRRGPDDQGHFAEDGVGLAMRRLSILDLEGGHQPISNEDGSITVVFNGEIYNYRALREDLLHRGHRFRTRSDTEVLVHLYEEYGTELTRHLRGMFAFAIWDRPERTLFVARDRLGIKPMYYAFHEGTLLFGSEIKSVLESRILPREIDWQAVDAFLTLTYVPAPLTIFRSVRKLRPGHHLLFQNGRLVESEYWDVDFSDQEHRKSESEWREEVEVGIQDAVTSHLVSDVPVGAFLSGGIDSSLVVAMMSKSLPDPVQTFTMAFDSAGQALRDERPFARMLGDRYPIAFNDFTVKPNLREIFDEILDAFDEPFADDSVVPTYYISKLTRRKVKVALSGLGGDELFGGYFRYQGLLMSRSYGLVPQFLRSGVVDPLVQLLPESGSGGDRIDHMKRFSKSSSLPPDERYLGYVSSIGVGDRAAIYNDEIRSAIEFEATSAVITEPFNRCQSPDILDRAFYTDLKTYLPDDILTLSDRLSMWHSLELRVPLVDHELTELAARIPSPHKVRLRSTKHLLRAVAKSWLPPKIIGHRKQGFESPMASWLRGELRGYAEDLLFGAESPGHGRFQMSRIRRLFDAHCAGEQKNNKILFSFMVLFGWMKRNGFT